MFIVVKIALQEYAHACSGLSLPGQEVMDSMERKNANILTPMRKYYILVLAAADV